jgi:hypothetical protein
MVVDGIPQYILTHVLNAPYPYINSWLEHGSLEPKHVANYILMIIYVLCFTELITLSKTHVH